MRGHGIEIHFHLLRKEEYDKIRMPLGDRLAVGQRTLDP